jgi:glycosyltransferase involved in cell wall biosynthesis
MKSASKLVYDVYTKIYDPETCEVHVKSTVSLRHYEEITPADEMDLLKRYAQEMKGRRLMFINATYAGGGVAIMRAPLIHLLRCLGVDAHWYVLQPDDEAFVVTKRKFHNVLQDVAGPGIELSDSDKAIYEAWIERNAKALEDPIRDATDIVIDDWQPSGLIPYIKDKFNPQATLLFRDHIQTEGELMGTPGTPQHTTWDYIWNHNRTKEADVFITHPVDEFVPPDVPDEKVVYMPATCDMLDDLNRVLTAAERRVGLAFINDQLTANEDQKPLDTSRPYIVLIARFDPSKGMPQGIESYALARKKMVAAGVPKKQLPQLVVLGNGSVDDPDGLPVLADIMALRSTKYSGIKDDIKIARVPHNDAAVNSLLGGASIALQPSTKEGFESRVTDAILQGVPVLGSSRGGIPLQIIEGESGYVIDPHNTEAWADRICELVTDQKKYQALRKRTKELAQEKNYEFTTVPNALSWLHLALEVSKNPHFRGDRKWSKELIAMRHTKAGVPQTQPAHAVFS